MIIVQRIKNINPKQFLRLTTMCQEQARVNIASGGNIIIYYYNTLLFYGNKIKRHIFDFIRIF